VGWLTKQKFMKLSTIILVILFFIQCCSQDSRIPLGRGFDFVLFHNTPVEKLANAVQNDKVGLIEKYVVDQSMPIDFQEQEFGQTLLTLSITNSKYNVTQKLLELGANPNIRSPKDNSTPFIEACSHINIIRHPDEFIALLIKYGADVNAIQITKVTNDKYVYYDTSSVLEMVLRAGELDAIKLLEKNGARFDVYPKNGLKSLITQACFNYSILEYLIFEKHVSIPDYCAFRQDHNSMPPRKIGLLELLNENGANSLSAKDKKIYDKISDYLKSKNP
jgi:ankyrin repeat protein